MLPADARVALTLRLLGGLTTVEIARAFLQPEPTIAQRIVRAKAKIRDACIAFAIPERAELPGRLDAVLQAIAVFVEHSTPDGDGDGVPDAAEPTIVGEVRLGSGADTFNVENGTVIGDISFGAGADALNITGGGAVTGAIRDADGLLAVSQAMADDMAAIGMPRPPPKPPAPRWTAAATLGARMRSARPAGSW